MAVLFVFNVDVRNLGTGALVSEALLIWARISRQRIQCPLDFEKHLLLRQSARLHPRGLECGLGARHQALKLRKKSLMFPHRSLDAFVGREAPLASLLARLPPLEFRVLMMDVGIPDEVNVQSPPQIVPFV